jgi:hypothetical protein
MELVGLILREIIYHENRKILFWNFRIKSKYNLNFILLKKTLFIYETTSSIKMFKPTN